MAHQPPIPPEQLSDKVQGEHAASDRKPEVKRDPAGGTADVNLSEQGQTANTIQNTTHQGHQQDR